MDEKVKEALEKKCEHCGSSIGSPHKNGKMCWQHDNIEEMKKQKFNCTDCGMEISRYDISYFSNNLPDRVCQSCTNDLIAERWEGGNIKDNLSDFRAGPPENPNDQHKQILWEFLGDERLKAGIQTRKGSSKLNIEFIKELRKRNNEK